MRTPFINDPFAFVWQAFKNLYPAIEVECYFSSQIEPAEDGAAAYGFTEFAEDGAITVFVLAELPVMDAAEILAHELAHAAAGAAQEHSAEWEAAFDAIHKEYNRIGVEVFGGEG